MGGSDDGTQNVSLGMSYQDEITIYVSALRIPPVLLRCQKAFEIAQDLFLNDICRIAPQS